MLIIALISFEWGNELTLKILTLIQLVFQVCLQFYKQKHRNLCTIIYTDGVYVVVLLGLTNIFTENEAFFKKANPFYLFR